MRTITKDEVRAAFLYMVGYLTKNSTERNSATTREITADISDEDIREIYVRTLKEMILLGWVKREGSTRFPIYTATCEMNAGKLKDDASITAAVEKLWPAFERTLRTDYKPAKEPEVEPEKTNDAPRVSEPVRRIVDDAQLIKEKASTNPALLVQALRENGWEVTARKTTIEEL